MSKVGAALATYGLGSHHTVRAIHDVGNRAGQRLVKAGPATAGIKLGVRVKQLGAAADAVVTAVSPVLLVLAGKGALSGRLAGDLERAGLGTLGTQHFLPFGSGFLDGKAHDEQLMEMDEAQSGGKSAHAAWAGCSE